MFDLEQSAMTNKKLKAAIKKLLSKDRKLIKMKDLRLLVKSNEELNDIKLSGKGRTKIAIINDLKLRIKQANSLIENKAMPKRKLKATIKRLLSKGSKEIPMENLRLLISSNEELSDIKLTGKGRTKVAIISDLESRIKQKKKAKCAKKKTKKQKSPQEDDAEEESDASDCVPFVLDPHARYPFNMLVWFAGTIELFIENEEDNHYAAQLMEECHKQDFSDWEDVEKRVVGFKKEMMQHYDSISWNFDYNEYRSGSLLCTFEHDHYKVNCPIVNVKEFLKIVEEQTDHSRFDMIDVWPEEEDLRETNLGCMNLSQANTKRKNKESRKPQQVPFKSGNIVVVAAFDKKSGQFKGHGSGCLIDEKHVLTCAHNCHPWAPRKFQNNYAWIIYLHDGSPVACAESVFFPKSWPPKNDPMLSRTKNSNDVAVLRLREPVKSKFPFPVFGLALKKYEHPKKGANITIDGYPSVVGYFQANEWDFKNKYFVSKFFGDFGKVTKSGLRSRSLRSLAFFTPGTSGAPAMLCDEQGQYLTNGEGPVIVGIAVSLGGLKTGENTVCVPMKPWTLAFISRAIGYNVNVHNEYVRRQMVCYMNKYKAKMKKYSQDDDVEMKCEN